MRNQFSLKQVDSSSTIHRYSHGSAVEWAARHGYETTARKALEEGLSKRVLSWGVEADGFSCNLRPWCIGALISRARAWSQPSWRLEKTTSTSEGTDNLLSLAASHGQESVVMLLLEYGASADLSAVEKRRTPLSLAAQGGYLGIVKLLAGAHCDLKSEDSTGYTPLVYAASGEHLSVTQFLFDNEINPGYSLRSSDTEAHPDPLSFICSYNHSPRSFWSPTRTSPEKARELVVFLTPSSSPEIVQARMVTWDWGWSSRLYMAKPRSVVWLQAARQSTLWNGVQRASSALASHGFGQELRLADQASVLTAASVGIASKPIRRTLENRGERSIAVCVTFGDWMTVQYGVQVYLFFV